MMLESLELCLYGILLNEKKIFYFEFINNIVKYYSIDCLYENNINFFKEYDTCTKYNIEY